MHLADDLDDNEAPHQQMTNDQPRPASQSRQDDSVDHRVLRPTQVLEKESKINTYLS